MKKTYDPIYVTQGDFGFDIETKYFRNFFLSLIVHSTLLKYVIKVNVYLNGSQLSINIKEISKKSGG